MTETFTPGAKPSGTRQSAAHRVCFVVSSPLTAEAFLTDQVRALSERHEVHLVVNADADSIEHPDLRLAKLHRARIERAISPLADFQGVVQLVGILRRGRYSSVHSVTPKAGFLTAIAGSIARVPVRLHTYTGQVWATRRGPGRWLLKSLDRVIARLATHVLVDSASQRDFLRRERVLPQGKGELIGKGSVSGVDGGRFKPDAAARASMRSALAIPPAALVFIFVGRLNRDKGVLDLASAFEAVARERDDAFLVLVGPDEDALGAEIRRRCGASASRLRFAGLTEEPQRFMAASDVFCLPSYREGFGSVIIEAAAAGLPAIGSRIYGIVDAIEEGKTGLIVPAGDVTALAASMRRLAQDEALRVALGQAARARALNDFSRDAVTSGLVAFYERVLPHKK